MNNEIISLSFFSGCLGLDLGLAEAGIEQKLACDFDKSCRETIKANLPNLPVIDDICNYSASDIKRISGLGKNDRPTIMVGGPPCQAFSTAGKRLSSDDPRGNLFMHFIHLADELQPDYLVIENVRGLLSAPLVHRPHNQRGNGFEPLSKEEQPGEFLGSALELLSNMGYCVSFNLYNAANYGVPQTRERVILIASRNGIRVPYLKPTHAADGICGLKKWNTFRGATKGLIEDEQSYLEFPEKRLRFYRMLKSGQHWRDLPTEELQKEALGGSYHSGGGKTGFLRRLDWDKPSPTLVTHPAMPATDLCHPEQLRPLSIEEYKRIQQFPDDWVIRGKLLDQYKQLGNAVPVLLGKAVGTALIEHIQGRSWDDMTLPNFRYSRYKKTSERDWNSSKSNFPDLFDAIK